MTLQSGSEEEEEEAAKRCPSPPRRREPAGAPASEAEALGSPKAEGTRQWSPEVLLCRAVAGCSAEAALPARFGVAGLAGREKAKNRDSFT